MWFARTGDNEEDEPRLNKPRKNKQHQVKEESYTSEDDDDDDDDAANPFTDVPTGLVQVKKRRGRKRRTDAAQAVEESDKKKDAAQAVEESDKKKDAAQAVEESDSDVAEDKMHPGNAVAKARVLTPRSEARLVPASKNTKQDMTDLAVAITTCEWKTIGASSRHKFVYNLFNGEHCVLKRLEAGFARTIDTGRIAVYLDCRCFHSKASHMLTPHLGKHFRILELIAADAKLVELFREVIATLQLADEAGPPADKLFVCKSSRHRSLAAGFII
jgi:hypothetical protein